MESTETMVSTPDPASLLAVKLEDDDIHGPGSPTPTPGRRHRKAKSVNPPGPYTSPENKGTGNNRYGNKGTRKCASCRKQKRQCKFSNLGDDCERCLHKGKTCGEKIFSSEQPQAPSPAASATIAPSPEPQLPSPERLLVQLLVETTHLNEQQVLNRLWVELPLYGYAIVPIANDSSSVDPSPMSSFTSAAYSPTLAFRDLSQVPPTPYAPPLPSPHSYGSMTDLHFNVSSPADNTFPKPQHQSGYVDRHSQFLNPQSYNLPHSSPILQTQPRLTQPTPQALPEDWGVVPPEFHELFRQIVNSPQVDQASTMPSSQNTDYDPAMMVDFDQYLTA